MKLHIAVHHIVSCSWRKQISFLWNVIVTLVSIWVFGWEKKNFKGKKNADLWLRYLELHPKFELSFIWVKGHDGHPENEKCDVLAYNAASNNPQNIDFFFEEEEK